MLLYFPIPYFLLILLKLQDPQPEYKLFGIIVHSGFSPESGHYYAYVKVRFLPYNFHAT